MLLGWEDITDLSEIDVFLSKMDYMETGSFKYIQKINDEDGNSLLRDTS